MLGGASIVSTALLSWVVFGRAVLRHHWLGICSSLIGFVIVGISSIVGAESDPTTGSTSGIFIGIFMISISIVLMAVVSNLQEYLFRRFELPVQREIGNEGHFGLIWILILLCLFSYIPCAQEGLCDVNRCFCNSIGRRLHG